jgi:hypothetical protein
VSGLNRKSSAKKSYRPPLCTRKSISEIGGLIRKKKLEMEDKLGTPRTSDFAGVQVLIVEGYPGDLSFLRPATGNVARQPNSFRVLDKEFIEMQFLDEQDAAPEIFSLLDLRLRPRGRGVQESAAGKLGLGNSVPYVILATSLEQVHQWRGIDPKHCWQLRNCPSPDDLMAALRTFLQLSAKMLNCLPGESACDKPALYALTGKAKQVGPL